MSLENRLPPLAEEPQDVRGPRTTAEADEITYRLGLQALPVPGLPATLTVDNVAVAFVEGPIRGQQTLMRQRYGFPVVFDKQMTRVPTGENELIALFSITTSPVPDDLETAFEQWRARALAAAGLVTAVLDERVAGHELFEDALLLHKGAFVGAADMRGRVRTFLPFDVNAADRAALAQLKPLSLAENSDVARAARLYRRAALEGPTADAYAMLWVAAECFSGHNSPSRKHIEAALLRAGLDPAGLPLHVGLLIDLRGKVQHHGLEVDDRLRTAYYEMEAVVRALIRQAANLSGGWWPASDNAAGFVEPFNHAVAALHNRGTTEWHPDGLPPVEHPRPERIPRRVPDPEADPRLDLDPHLGDASEFVAGILVDALEWLDPDAEIKVEVGLPPDAPPEMTAAASAKGIKIAEERLEDLESAGVVANLAWDLHALVAAVLVQRAGLVSEGIGAMVIEAAGAWAQYRRFESLDAFDPGVLNIPKDTDLISLGKLAGWAAAGDKRAGAVARRLRRQNRKLVNDVIEMLQGSDFGAPFKVIDLAIQSGAFVVVEG